MSRPALVLVVAALAGCGGAHSGTATIWITRDEGAHVMLQKRVPAGLTALQALDRVARIDTRYGGRFVQAIDGIAGSSSRRRDWFYFVNGYEADRGAAEYRLRSGDVEWWDYRSWASRMRAPVVVGAFPQPFVNGFAGHRRPTVVQYDDPTRTQALTLGKRLHARILPLGRPIGPQPNVLRLTCRRASNGPSIRARFRFGEGRPGAPILYTVDCAPNFERLARLRYQVPQ